MSKAQRIKANTARERIAAQQAAARRTEQRRKVLLISGSITVVIAIIVVLVVVKLAGGGTKQKGTGYLPAAVQREIMTVPASSLAKVGTGAVAADTGGSVPIEHVSGAPLVSHGKPELLFIGAEFCPYCAATRWAIAVALSKFGTFGPLTGIHSSSADVYPNTPTVTFYKSTYTSPYITFVPVESEKVNHAPLQATTAQQQAIWAKYDNPHGGPGWPFLDFGGKYVFYSWLYLPSRLKGLTWAQVAAGLHNPSSSVAQGADADANYMIAAICEMTKNSPASVCKAAPIPMMERGLPGR